MPETELGGSGLGAESEGTWCLEGPGGPGIWVVMEERLGFWTPGSWAVGDWRFGIPSPGGEGAGGPTLGPVGGRGWEGV